jgi:trans-aconitate methyltransferase
LQQNGILAVQMPVNWQEPSHALMREVAEELGHPASGRQPLPDVSEYYAMLTASGCEVDIWHDVLSPTGIASGYYRMAALYGTAAVFATA